MKKTNIKVKWEFDPKTKKSKFYKTYSVKNGGGVDLPQNKQEEKEFQEEYYKHKDW